MTNNFPYYVWCTDCRKYQTAECIDIDTTSLYKDCKGFEREE